MQASFFINCNVFQSFLAFLSTCPLPTILSRCLLTYLPVSQTLPTCLPACLPASLPAHLPPACLQVSPPGVNFTNFYEQLFHTKVSCAAFMCLQFGFVILWQKNFGTKIVLKMLVKLTPAFTPALLPACLLTHLNACFHASHPDYFPSLQHNMFGIMNIAWRNAQGMQSSLLNTLA
jgi:hypothetical protein